jgi:GTP pyrophosphokinase
VFACAYLYVFIFGVSMTLKSSFISTLPPVEGLDWVTWLRAVLANRPEEDIGCVMRAADLLNTMDPKHLTYCHLAPVKHAQSLIKLGVECSVDAVTLAAVMLYPIYEQGMLSSEVLDEQLDASVCQLLQGALRMNVLEEHWGSSQDAASSEAVPADVDAMRRMLLAMVDDVRTVVVRLLVQLCRLYHFKSFSAQQQKTAARFARQLYAPLANRLGMGQLKWQLEDFAFRILEPDAYQQIAEAVNARRDQRQAQVDALLEQFDRLLKPHVSTVRVTGRVKHFHSIYMKMKRKQLDFEELYDTLALRVIVSTLTECYTVLSQIQSTFTVIESEFNDYIAAPKSNGYQSIHTALRTQSDWVVEVQIRTQAMHDFAESGVASHWLYKEGGGVDVADKVNWLNQLMAWQSEWSEDQAGIHCFQDRVFVFTPQGDVKDLPLGATALDFAYSVHTEVGHRCRGAKVNKKIVTLSTPLNNGDRVQIITAQQAEPSRDWLNADPAVLCTQSARSKVVQWFRRQNHDALFERGQLLLSRAIKGKINPSKLKQVAQVLGYDNINTLMFGLARGELTATTVARRLQSEAAHEAKPTEISNTTRQVVKSPGRSKALVPVQVEGLRGMLVHLAQCCFPLPGEPILGRVSRHRGVMVHCQNCVQISDSAGHEDRLLSVTWESNLKGLDFPVVLLVQVEDVTVATQSLQQWLSNQKICWTDWHSSQTHAHTAVGLRVTLRLESVKVLQQCLKAFPACSGVVSVHRLG